MTERQTDRVISMVQAVLLAAIAAGASYCKSTDHSDDKNAVVRKRSDVGYETLVKSVEDLQREVAKLQARQLIDDVTANPLAVPPLAVAPAKVLDLPATLTEAVKQQEPTF